MRTCPICTKMQATSFAVCPVCGFDESVDMECYPTFSSSKKTCKSKTRRIQEYLQRVDQYSEKDKFWETGKCGANIQWKMYRNGTLMIEGSGMMPRCHIYPWEKWSEKIQRLEILSGICSISAGAFREAKRLVSVHLSDTVLKIESSAFLRCESLSEIFWPDSISIIGACAFRYCSGLEEVRLPKQCREIYAGAFGYCKGLKKIFLPEKMKIVRNGLFKNCEHLSEVFFSQELEQIEAEAFWGCRSLWSIQIPTSTVCEQDAFKGCKIEILRMSQSSHEKQRVDDFGNLWESGLYKNNVQWKFYENGALILSGIGPIQDSDRMDLENGYPWKRWSREIRFLCIRPGITSIGAFAFACIGGIEEVRLPNTLMEIRAWAFWNCGKLSGLTIPPSVCSIGSFAFSQCDELKEVILPEQCSEIGDAAFGYCKKLSRVVLPKELTKIEERTFEGCKNLFSISVPQSLIEIHSRAFAECEKLWMIQVPARTKIEKNAFLGCKVEILRFHEEKTEAAGEKPLDKGKCGQHLEWKLYESGKMVLEGAGLMPYSEIYPWQIWHEKILSLEIKGEIRSIARYAFYGLNHLEQIQLPNTLVLVEDMAFFNCNKLKKVVIPNSVRCIGAFAFSHCRNMTELILPEYCPVIEDGAFSYCNKLKSVSLPEGMEIIWSGVFKGCENLSFIVLPNKLQEIQAEAFAGCKLLKFPLIRKELKIAPDAFEV